MLDFASREREFPPFACFLDVRLNLPSIDAALNGVTFNPLYRDSELVVGEGSKGKL